MAERGYVTDPKSWAQAIKDVGPNYAVIFALLAVLGYLAFQGVPAIIGLTMAINHNTDTVVNIAGSQTATQARLVDNQSKDIQNQAAMIEQHGDMIGLLRELQAKVNRDDIQVDDLMADKKSRDARNRLRER